MAEQEEAGRERIQQRQAPERAPVGPAIEAPAPALVPVEDARGVGGGMRDTLEAMDAVSRQRMVSDMQRRAGNVAVGRVLGQPTAGSVPNQIVVKAPAQKAKPLPRTSLQDAARSAAPKQQPSALQRSAAPAERGGSGGSGGGLSGMIMASLVEHESGLGHLGGGAVGRDGPAIAGGGDGIPPDGGRGAARGLFRGIEYAPGGGLGETPEDRTTLDPAFVAELVAELWERGVVRGEAADLSGYAVRAGASPDAADLRSFAMLAALNERALVPALDFTLGAEDPASDVLAGAALLWRRALLSGGDALDPGGLQAAADALDPDDPHSVAAEAWLSLAWAEALGVVGEVEPARERLEDLAEADPDVPVGIRIAAAQRLGTLDAFVDPDGAADRLAGAGDLAVALGHAPDAAYAHCRAGLVVLLAEPDPAEPATHLRAAVTASPEQPTPDTSVASAMLALVDRPGDAGALAVLAEAAREAIADGDYLLAVSATAASARAQQRGGDTIAAVGTLFTGIAQTTRAFGPGTAGPLETERDSLAAVIGHEAFKEAMRHAITRMERGLAQRTGPAAPPA